MSKTIEELEDEKVVMIKIRDHAAKRVLDIEKELLKNSLRICRNWEEEDEVYEKHKRVDATRTGKC